MPTRRHYRERYQPYYKHSKKIFAFDMILLAIIVGLLIINGYYLFFRQAPSEKVMVVIRLDSETVKSGQEATFIIDYVNQEEATLEGASLSFQLPPHFYARQFFPPVNQETTTFHLGDLASGAKGQLKINGRILGEAGQNQKIYTTLNYRMADWRQPGQKNSFLEYQIEDSLLKLSLSLPEKIKINELFDYTLNYANESFGEFANIIIRPDWPKNFHLTKAEPALANEEWDIPGLGQGSQGQINLEGLLNSMNPGQFFCFTSYVVIDGQELKQSQVCQDPAALPAKISFSQLVNNQEDYVAQLGEELNYAIGYQNDSPEYLKQVALTLSLDSELYDLSSLTAVNGQKENNIIRWPKIAVLGPGQTGELKFKVKLKRAVSDPPKDLAAIIRPQANYLLLNEPTEMTGPDLVTKINTGLILKALARYYSAEGEQLGVGPLPPIAGQTTKYWILLQPITTSSAVSNITVSAVLPANVDWGGQVISSLGRGMEYNPQTRTITWQIDKLEPFNEEEQKFLGGGFEVRVTPTTGQIGQSAVLLKDITIIGQDDFTNKRISDRLPDITTDLRQDAKALGQGMVQEK
ncbi:MAG: hypothetical protein V1692_01030 [bacterium]